MLFRRLVDKGNSNCVSVGVEASKLFFHKDIICSGINVYIMCTKIFCIQVLCIVHGYVIGNKINAV